MLITRGVPGTHDIKKLIKPVAFYKIKAKKIKQVAEIIYKEYDSKVPKEMEQLLELPLVGRKTANCVLGEIYNENRKQTRAMEG